MTKEEKQDATVKMIEAMTKAIPEGTKWIEVTELVMNASTSLLHAVLEKNGCPASELMLSQMFAYQGKEMMKRASQKDKEAKA